jgi:hypothetical protein
LGGETEALAGFLLTELVESALFEGLGLEGAETDPVTGVVAALQGVLQGAGLLGGGLELDFDDELHGLGSRDALGIFFKRGAAAPMSEDRGIRRGGF